MWCGLSPKPQCPVARARAPPFCGEPGMQSILGLSPSSSSIYTPFCLLPPHPAQLLFLPEGPFPLQKWGSQAAAGREGQRVRAWTPLESPAAPPRGTGAREHRAPFPGEGEKKAISAKCHHQCVGSLTGTMGRECGDFMTGALWGSPGRGVSMGEALDALSCGCFANSGLSSAHSEGKGGIWFLLLRL